MKKLGALLGGVDIRNVSGPTDVEVSGVAFDSRETSEGHVFVAIRGGRLDGRLYIADALKRGAAAVVYENGGWSTLPAGQATMVCVHDARAALASISNAFYGRPSEGMVVIGVTGTNGKTTTAYLIKSVLEAAGHKVGLIGTIDYRIGARRMPAAHTTPEAPAFQGLLREMLDEGCTHAVSEVSSHALDQKRVDGTVFSAAVFTNLTRDHLDYHYTMQDYFAAKKRLFEEMLKGPAVINVDDAYGRTLRDILSTRTLTFGLDAEADLGASSISSTKEGLSFTVDYWNRSFEVRSQLSGIVNVYNILAAAGTALALGVSPEHIERGIASLGGVPGRFQKVRAGQEFLCVVDYAHTEDALRRLIKTARGLVAGKVITVFGCGGDRDRGKRPAMGAAAAELSDYVIVTSDNPRGEAPGEIISEILTGMGAGGPNGASSHDVIPDRREAIAAAIRAAGPEDAVVIAGKGHEEYQEVKGVRHYFSDVKVAEETIGEALGSRNVHNA